MFAKVFGSSLCLLTIALLVGCGSGANSVVEAPDQAELQAKQNELAEFQKKMAEKQKLGGN